MPVAVRCRLGSVTEVMALLDTGATWSVVDSEVANLLEGHLEPLGTPGRITTRHGSFSGTLHRLDVELIADAGTDLKVDATVLVLPGWPGPMVLGFEGLLERIRFALDPDDTAPTFYFGPRG